MSSTSFTVEIKSLIAYKFGSLKSGAPLVADTKNSINLLPQVQEITIYESIWTPLMKCEIAVVDYIGLFTNFPLTGEEIIILEYRNVADDIDRTHTMAIDRINDIVVDKNNRAQGYILSCVSIEGLANSLGTVQQGYRGTTVSTVEKVFKEHIANRITDGVKGFYPSYNGATLKIIEDNSSPEVVRIIPNMHPLAAIDMLNMLADTNNPERYTYLFFQNSNGFNFRTLQSLIHNEGSKNVAWNNKYKYMSNEIRDGSPNYQNEERVISNIAFNKRHSSMQKLSTGYFNNNAFEINLAQKAVHNTAQKMTDVKTIENYPLNTQPYIDWADTYVDDTELSNRTKYTVTNRPEGNIDYPIIETTRTRWGKDLISKIALSQVDLTVVIPGTNRFVAGDLFYIEIPEFHGFEDLQNDDFVSGYYLITEIKQIIAAGGYQSTTLRLNKDSYRGDVNRNSKYNQSGGGRILKQGNSNE